MTVWETNYNKTADIINGDIKQWQPLITEFRIKVNLTLT